MRLAGYEPTPAEEIPTDSPQAGAANPAMTVPSEHAAGPVDAAVAPKQRRNPANGDRRITEPQQKRLRARMHHFGLDAHEARIKKWCATKWGMNVDDIRLSELSRDQYQELDGQLEAFAERIAIELEQRPANASA